MVNKFHCVGNLGKDPELRYTPSGNAVVNFSVALSEKFKDRDGQQQETTTWINIVAWKALAENCGKYLQKGSKVYVEGKLTTRSWDDKDGNKKYITEIVASDVKFLSPKGEGQAPPSAGWQREEPPFDPEEDIPFS